MNELQLQSAFFLWAWNTYPQARGYFWHVTNEMKPMRVKSGRLLPNGQPEWIVESDSDFRRRIGQAKAAGLVPGVYDIHVFWMDKFSIIEIKVGDNGLTPEQVAWGQKMYNHGAKRYVGYDLPTLQSIFSSIINSK